MSTAEAVLSALRAYALHQLGPGSYRCNSPFRPGSNSHACSVAIDDGEHGTWHDFVSGEGGSLYDLADRLGIPRPAANVPLGTKRAYPDLDAYAQDHGVSGAVFRAFGWGDATTYQQRPALPFRTATGIRYRFIDGDRPVYKSPRSYVKSWYWLDRALVLADTGQPLVLCNGEASSIAGQAWGVAATCVAGGGEQGIPPVLLDELQRLYPPPGPILVALDCDRTGRTGALRSLDVLRAAGYQARAVDLGGSTGFDLADFCRLHQHASGDALAALGDLAGTRPVELSVGDISNGRLVEANQTDTGNAECLVACYGSLLRYDHKRRSWLVWDGQRWTLDDDGAAQRYALLTVRARYHAATAIADLDCRTALARWAIRSESTAKLSALLTAASTQVAFATRVEQYDQLPMLASTPAGTLDLETGLARPPRQEEALTMQLGAASDARASCPRWERFLSEIFAGDAELIAYVQRAVGYSLTGDTREQKLFLCWGSGANGKSVFLSVLERLLGDYAANASFETFDAARRTEATNDLAMLRGRRLVTIIETNEDRRLDEAKVKAVTGGDRITCRFLYGEYFTYQPTFKIWLAMNHKPGIRGTDRGIWRRIALIPFTQNFEGRENRRLAAELTAELSGILNWALAGLAVWRGAGLGSARAVEEATEVYRRESDELGKWLGEDCIVDAAGVLVSSEAYQQFLQWSKNRGERYPMTQNAWSRQMSERGYQSQRRLLEGHRIAVYQGLRLRTRSDPADAGDGIDGIVVDFPGISRKKKRSQEIPAKRVSMPSMPSSSFTHEHREEKREESSEENKDEQADASCAPGCQAGIDGGQSVLAGFGAGEGTVVTAVGATGQTSYDHDRRLTHEVRQLVAGGKLARAREKAGSIRSRKLMLELFAWIDQVEQGAAGAAPPQVPGATGNGRR